MTPAERHNDELVRRLTENCKEGCYPPQTRSSAVSIGESALSLLFPHLSSTSGGDPSHVATAIEGLRRQVRDFQQLVEPIYANPDHSIPDALLDKLVSVHEMLKGDAQAMYHGDPAAESVEEVILAYPGFRAIATFRVAHELLKLGMPILPRLLTEWAHTLTGVDIHPGATIGRNFSIDHGTGVVIGESSVIGKGVRLYQGVTLGALAVLRENRGKKRHPTVEDNVVIYSHATILGGDTTVGHDSVIGGNAWITESVPAFSVVNRQSEVRPRRSSSGSDEAEFHI